MRNGLFLVLLGGLLGLMVVLGGLSYKAPIQREAKPLVELRIELLGSVHKELYNASGVTIERLLRVRHNITHPGRLRCLDGVCDSGGYYWHLSVNGKPANFGIKSYRVKPGDVVVLNFSRYH